MQRGLRALLAEIIDYAGMFPPARLDLASAITHYARYTKDPCAWLLARFICPAAQLSALGPFAGALFGSASPLRVSVLGRDGGTAEEFLAGVRLDAAAVDEWAGKESPPLRIEAYEVRLPADVSDNTLARELIEAVAATWAGTRRGPLPAYFEPPWTEGWRKTWTAVIAGAAEVNRFSAAGGMTCGFKLRCGGQEPSAIPTPEQTSAAMVAIREWGIPIKFTAGLHHPLRHVDEQGGSAMHGFVNVFAAGVLGAAHGLGEAQIAEMLCAESPGAFRVEGDGLSYGGWTVDAGRIERLRRDVMISFGSCSFEEPRDGLDRLGWLR